MELSPNSVRTAAFKTVRKGYDPTEVDSFKDQVAAAIESAQNQATAMEARARAAVAKLQEVTHAGAAKEATPSGGTSETPAAGAAPSPDAASKLSATDAENISRTLLLAQHTADTTVSEATTQAEAITSAARDEAAAAIDAAHATAAGLVDEARREARRASEDERIAAEGEVQALVARRDFLVSDVEHLEQHIHTQRERLREAAATLQDVAERVPGGLGDLRRPLLSASDTDGDDRAEATPHGTLRHGPDDDLAPDDGDAPPLTDVVQPAGATGAPDSGATAATEGLA